jgi:hypothetical protein
LVVGSVLLLICGILYGIGVWNMELEINMEKEGRV